MPNLKVTRTTLLDTDNDENGIVDPGDILRTTIVIEHDLGSVGDALNVVINDSYDGSTLVPNSINVSPIANNDTYAAIGNTLLVAGGAANPSGAPALTTSANVFDNDSDTLSGAPDTFTASVASSATAQGGTVSMSSDGAFTYTPAPGFTGADSFTYTITDSGGLTNSATVTINVSGQVWYVDGDAATNGDGTSANPFNSLASVNGAGGAGDVDDAGDYIYFEGSETANLVLETGQSLIGSGADLVVGGFTLATAGAQSSIGAASGTVVSLATDNDVAGLDIAGTGTSTGISGTVFGNLSISDGAISGGTGGAIVLADGAASSSVALSGLDLSSTGGDVLAVDGTAGAGTLTVTDISNVAIEGGNGEVGGAGLFTVVFDSDLATAGFQAVDGGAFSAGTVAGPVGGYGLLLYEVSGSLDFDSTDVAVTRATNPVFGVAANNVATGIYLVANANTGSTFDFGTGSVNSNSVASSGSSSFFTGAFLQIGAGNSAGFSGGADVTSTGGAMALRATGAGGSFFIGGSDNDLSASGTGSMALNLNGVSVSNGSGGSAQFDTITGTGGSTAIQTLNITTPAAIQFNGTVTATNTTGTAVNLSNGGSVVFNGFVDLNQASTGQGLVAANLSSLTLAGGFDIDVAAGNALSVTSSSASTFNVVGTNTSVDNAGTGAAVVLGSNVTVGNGSGGAATFTSVTSTGFTNASGAIQINSAGQAQFGTVAVTPGASANATFGIEFGTNATGTYTFTGDYDFTGGAGDIGIFVNKGANGNALNVNFQGDVDITSTTGAGVSIADNGTGGSLNFQMQNVNSSIVNTGTASAFVVTGGTGTISSAAAITNSGGGYSASINGRTGGSVTLSGDISDTSQGITVGGGTSAGTVNFSGDSKALNTGTNQAVTISTQNAVNFTNGGLDIDTTGAAGHGFFATTGGTVTVTGTGNTITTSGGVALSVTNTNIGAAGLNFHSISANGGASGIVLTNTGGAAGNGGLTVTGDGSANNNGSGGTIQNSTGTGAILVDGTKNLVLNQMNITNSGVDGININNINGLTLNRVNITDNSSTSGVQTHQGIQIGDFSTGTAVNGTINITDTNVTFSPHDNLAVGIGSGTSTWNITGSTFSFSGGNGAGDGSADVSGNSGVNFEIRNAAVVSLLTFTGNTLEGNFADGMQIQPAGGTTGSLTALIQGNTFKNNNIGLDLNSDGSADMTYHVLNNTFLNDTRRVAGGAQDAAGQAINVFMSSVSTSAASLNARIVGNVVGNNSTPGSGSSNGSGIRVNYNGDGTGAVLIDGNQIYETPNGRGIEVIGRNGTGQLDVTITNNTIDHTNLTFHTQANGGGSDLPLAGIFVQSNTVPTAGYTVRADVRANTVVGNGTLSELTPGWISLVETGASNLQLVDTPAGPGGQTPDQQLSTANPNATSTDTTSGVSLIAGPINVPPALMLAESAPPASELEELMDDGIVDAPEVDNSGTTGEEAPPSGEEPSPLGEEALPESIGAITPPSAPVTQTPPPAAPTPAPSGSVVVDDGILSAAELSLIVNAAIARWEAAGATPEQVAAMRAVTVSVSDLGGLQVGSSTAGSIVIDTNAAGWRWFVDATPGDDSEYVGSGTVLSAASNTNEAGTRIDLLTVMMHELGHQIGLSDSYAASDAHELMSGTVRAGERRLPGADDAAAGGNTAVSGSATLAAINYGTLVNGETITVTYRTEVPSQTPNGPVTNVTGQTTVSGSNFTTVQSDSDPVAGGPQQEIVAVDSLRIGNLVYLDVNNDGDYDSGTDQGIDGVSLTLFADTGTVAGELDAGDTQIGSPIDTSGGGLYSFSGLAPGDYIVRVDAANFDSGNELHDHLSTAGGNDADSDVDDNDDNGIDAFGSSIASYAITLSYGDETEAGPTGPALDTNNTLDFGFIDPNEATTISAADTDVQGTEDSDLVFSSGNSNAITVADADDDTLTVTLTVTSGTLTLSQTTNLNITAGADGSTTMTIEGLASDINAALAGLIYRGGLNYQGTDTLAISVGDGLASDSENIAITLSDDGKIDGTPGGDDIIGTPQPDYILGYGGGDDIDGAGANDIIDGGAGADTMMGGLGNDTYYVDNAGDLTNENPGEGNDAVSSTIDWTLQANTENLALLGTGDIDGTGNALANVIIGNSGVNTLDGGEGADTLNGMGGDDVMIGGIGNDTFFVDSAGDQTIENAGQGIDTVRSTVGRTLDANIENLMLIGNAAINGLGNGLSNTMSGNSAFNILSGAGGNDTLSGGAGPDQLIGGTGDDVYVVDDAGDDVVENMNDGTDHVLAAIIYTLAANVENVTLTGSSNIGATGNGLDNKMIGNSGDNSLTGGGGHDSLNGGAGADTMAGGTGNDLYIVDNVNDDVVENLNEGTDSVQSSITYALDDNLEYLFLSGMGNIDGTGNGLDNSIEGNGGNNVIDGGVGADMMRGHNGNDTYVVDNAGDRAVELSATGGTDTVLSSVHFNLGAHVENLTLTGTGNTRGNGNGLDNVLTGNTGNNTLNGLGGADTMIGGTGNDIYFVDHAGDSVVENSGEGVDTVHAAISHTLADHVDYLYLSGTGNINGTGNGLDNTMEGNAGNNVLDGGAGADFMRGGAGNDTYVVDNALDKAVELNAAGGTDTVQSSVSFILAGHLENLTLTGSGNINGTGNTLANTIAGNGGNNVLRGNVGADALTGGAGTDTFIYGLVADSDATNGIDTILDFFSGDKIDLSAIDANGAGAGNGTFSFTAGAFTNVAGQLRAEDKGGYFEIQGDTDGDGDADLVINLVLADADPITSGDFVL